MGYGGFVILYTLKGTALMCDSCVCSLRALDLASNELEGLPSPLQWKTQMLKELIVSRNKITKVCTSHETRLPRYYCETFE
jgi:hypothetical protein